MNLVHHHVHRVINSVLFDGLRDSKDVLAMQRLEPLSGEYLPWSQAAMRASAVAAILNDIVINSRSYVVECGGGVSTFYIGRLLKRLGGHLHTIEDDAAWANILRQHLEKEGLTEQVTVVCAPLKKSPIARGGGEWYDETKLEDILAGGRIDLLVVDGPAAYSPELMYSRYPAVPFFARALAEDYTIVLDDINRRGEQEILEGWERELRIRFDRRFVDGTIAIGRPRTSFGV